MSEITKKLVATLKARIANQDLKGKKRDQAALEFFCGAAAALEAVSHKEAEELRAKAFFISLRGYDLVERLGEEATEHLMTEAGPDAVKDAVDLEVAASNLGLLGPY